MWAWLRRVFAGCTVLTILAACGGSAFTAADGGGGGGAGGAGGGEGAGGGGGSGGNGGSDAAVDSAPPGDAGCSAIQGRDLCEACCAYANAAGHDQLYNQVWKCTCNEIPAPCDSSSACNSQACNAPPKANSSCTSCLEGALKATLSPCAPQCQSDCQAFLECFDACSH